MTPALAPLGVRARPRLERAARAAIKRARRRGRPVLVGVAVDEALDPVAVAFASRRGGEPLFALGQPDRGGFGLAGLGAIRALPGPGTADRFATAGRAWRAALADAVQS